MTIPTATPVPIPLDDEASLLPVDDEELVITEPVDAPVPEVEDESNAWPVDEVVTPPVLLPVLL
jgi:hypothetical protein